MKLTKKVAINLAVALGLMATVAGCPAEEVGARATAQPVASLEYSSDNEHFGPKGRKFRVESRFIHDWGEKPDVAEWLSIRDAQGWELVSYDKPYFIFREKK